MQYTNEPNTIRYRFSSPNRQWKLIPGSQFVDFKIKNDFGLFSTFHAETPGFPNSNDVTARILIDDNNIYIEGHSYLNPIFITYWTQEHTPDTFTASIKRHIIATAIGASVGFGLGGPVGALGGGLVAFEAASFVDIIHHTSIIKPHRYYSLKISDETGELYVEAFHNAQNRNDKFEDFFDVDYKRTVVWTSDRTNRSLLQNFDSLEDYLEHIYTLELTHTLSTSDFNDFHWILINENFFKFNGEVYNINDIYDYIEGISSTLTPTNSLRGDINVNHTYSLSERGTIEIRDFESNNIDEIGSECIKFPTGEDHRISLDENGDIIVSSTSRKLFTQTNHTTKCEFPSEGVSSLGNQKLIQYNQTPDNNNNELTYLISSDKKNIVIKHDGQLKVINKDDFNGNFITSPSVQVLDLN